jgi:hypothetical protein
MTLHYTIERIYGLKRKNPAGAGFFLTRNYARFFAALRFFVAFFAVFRFFAAMVVGIKSLVCRPVSARHMFAHKRF